MSDEELIKIAFAKDKTVADILRHIFNLGVEKGRADAIEPIMKGYKELVELENLLTRYFCEVDLRADKTDLEKLALKISSDGIQTIGWLVDELEQIGAEQ